MWRPTGYDAAVGLKLSVTEHVNEYRLPAEGSILSAYLKLQDGDYHLARKLTPRRITDMPTDEVYGVPRMYAVFDNRIRLYPTPDRPYSLSYTQLQADASDMLTPLPYGDPSSEFERLIQEVDEATAIVQRSLLSGDVAKREWTSRNRSIALLRDWLTPKQLAQFNEFRNFYVYGSESHKLYLINYAARPYNVTDGVLDYCFIPAPSSGASSPGDIMLAQKIALETNETKALSLAHKNRRRAPVPNFGKNHEVYSNETGNAIDLATRDALLRFSGCITDMGS